MTTPLPEAEKIRRTLRQKRLRRLVLDEEIEALTRLARVLRVEEAPEPRSSKEQPRKEAR